MKAYNIYYQNMKINNKPISKHELVNDILKQKQIFKKSQNQLIKIDTDKIKIVETILV